LILLSLILTPLAFYLLSFFGTSKSSENIIISELFLRKNTNSPSLVLRVLNNSDHPKLIFGSLVVEDKAAGIKKQISLGSLGEIMPLTQKDFSVDWNEPWQGSGIGQLKAVLYDQDGVISEKSMPVAVIPENLESVGAISLFASLLLGAGLVISRFV